MQPNVFCIYKFFDFHDHVTHTIESSNNPEINDYQKYSVAMDTDLDKYLKTNVH